MKTIVPKQNQQVCWDQLQLRAGHVKYEENGFATFTGRTQEYECQRYFELEMAFGAPSSTAEKSFRDASASLRRSLSVANSMARPSTRARRYAGKAAMMSSSFIAIAEVLR